MISVIIPVYNEEKYIERCLISLQNQTLPRKSYEIIVVNDGSVDKTAKIAKKYVDKLINQKNMGVYHALNRGIKNSKGGIIVKMDADVIISKDCLEKIIKSFSDKSVVTVACRLMPLEYNFKNSTLFAILNVCSDLAEVFWLSNLTPLCAFRKSAFLKVGQFDTSLSHGGDFELALRLNKVGRFVNNRNIFVATSARRFMKRGYMRTLGVWLLRFIGTLTDYKAKICYGWGGYGD